ncbi:MAG: alpha-mannosidase [Mastigocoleus sp. MO_167.B18]|nr:alpha-mannosidase [Mastigocoleus sp. MO_167.B18]
MNSSNSSEQSNKLIFSVIDKLRSFSQINVQSQWHYQTSELNVNDISTSDFSQCNVAQLNKKEHIPWKKGRNVLWLTQKVIVPENLYGYNLQNLSLRLALVWWADSAEVYVNGKLVAEGDLFDFYPRVLLAQRVNPGDEFIVSLKLISPGHDDGALVKSALIYESNLDGIPEPGFVADELAVLHSYLKAFAPQELDTLAIALGEFNWETNPQNSHSERNQIFNDRLLALRQKLCELKFKLDLPKLKIFLLGHAHLDMAWLWRVSETWQAAKNTFESVLQLQEDFSELIFCHSTPALYDWIEQNYPKLFNAIEQKIKVGRWENVGGMWVEPELNLISGESIVRQLLYGQHYALEKFGKISRVVWLPDSFGFCWSLPQFLINAGIEYFVTQKLRWNDTTKFDYGQFRWRSPDGSEIFSLMSAPIGEGIDPVKMVDYGVEWHNQTGLLNSLWLPGVGDHGGGPTRDMLEIARRWQKSPLFPELEFTTAEKYLQSCRNGIAKETNPTEITLQNLESGEVELPVDPEKYPVWNDELYLEFHRGCYTTHADQKRWNRRCENLLYQAELFASLLTIRNGTKYPKAELEVAWKKLLFNQFHDILPGSSITEVYEDALPEWQEIQKIADGVLQKSLQGLAAQINFPKPPYPESLPLVVFNSLNWQRSEVVSISVGTTKIGKEWQVYDVSGNKVISQLGDDSNLLFLANDIPSIGYRVFWLCCGNVESTESLEKEIFQGKVNSDEEQQKSDLARFTLENEFLRAIVDEENGNLSSIFDKTNNREVLGLEGGNQLQAFQDSGQYWDAWNIDPDYAKHQLPPMELESIQWIERGAVQSRLRVVRRFGKSEFQQDYILQAACPMLKIASKVVWLERQVIVKAAFTLNLYTSEATYEIPCATIIRPTKPQTIQEKAKWEVPALRWADLTAKIEETGVNSDFLSQNPSAEEQNYYGVSIINDCKYGYDAQPNQLRLTLLRSPNWPNPEADKGLHEFTYAVYPHQGKWSKAQTVKRGYELNIPLQVVQLGTEFLSNLKAGEYSCSPSMPSVGNFLNLSADNLILMAFKQTEENPEQWILRCYECHGETANFSLQSSLGLKLRDKVDLLERSICTSQAKISQSKTSQTQKYQSPSEQQSVTIEPWKIFSFKLSLEQ